MISAVYVSLAFIVAVNAGSQPIVKSSGWGWGGQPPPPPPPPPTNIVEAGASEAVGAGGSVAEHVSSVSITGSAEVPAIASLGAGSNVGLDQYTSNYQQSQINTDGSSAAYQGNSASNGGYANEFLNGVIQGLNANVLSQGWTATEGEGAVGQIDALGHDGGPTGGWNKEQ